MKEEIGKLFMEMTRRENTSPSPQSLGIPQPSLQLDSPPGAKRIALCPPEHLEIPAIDLRSAIEQRETVRHYSSATLSLDELSFLLWCTQGVKDVRMGEHPRTHRTVPSAGARHAFETYLLANRVGELEPGIYRYDALEHALLVLDLSAGLAERVTAGCNDQRQVADSAVTFLWAAVVERMFFRYVERGYRYLFLDAGHVCQNLYLAAQAVGCGICPIGAYDDVRLNQVLGLDGQDQFVLYAASLGKRLF